MASPTAHGVSAWRQPPRASRGRAATGRGQAQAASRLLHTASALADIVGSVAIEDEIAAAAGQTVSDARRTAT